MMQTRFREPRNLHVCWPITIGKWSPAFSLRAVIIDLAGSGDGGGVGEIEPRTPEVASLADLSQ